MAVNMFTHYLICYYLTDKLIDWWADWWTDWWEEVMLCVIDNWHRGIHITITGDRESLGLRWQKWVHSSYRHSNTYFTPLSCNTLLSSTLHLACKHTWIEMWLMECVLMLVWWRQLNFAIVIVSIHFHERFILRCDVGLFNPLSIVSFIFQATDVRSRLWHEFVQSFLSGFEIIWLVELVDWDWVDWLTDWLTGFTNWLINRLIGCLMNYTPPFIFTWSDHKMHSMFPSADFI